MSAAATLSETLEPLRADPARAGVLLDVDGTLAPIVRHADDAAVPEPTRALLIQVARRYGCVACVSGRQATSPARSSPSARSPTSATTASSSCAPVAPRSSSTARSRPGSSASGGSRDDAHDEELHRLRVRAEDKRAIAAFHWRGAPDEEAAEEAVAPARRRAPRRPGLRTHWGRKVLEVRPPVDIDKGRGLRRLLKRRGPEGRGLRRGRPHGRRRVRRPARARGAGPARDGGVRRRALGGDAARARGGGRRARRRPAGRAGAARDPAVAAGGALRRLPQGDGHAQRRRGHRARGRHRAVRGRRGRRHAAGLRHRRVVGARRGRRDVPRPAGADEPADHAAARGRAVDDDAPRAAAEPPAHQPAVAARGLDHPRDRPGARRPADPRDRRGLRDGVGAGVAAAGRRGGGDRGPRRRGVLHRADVAA